MGRFILTKSPGNTFRVEDKLGILPLLFFTDLTIALKCKDELNRLASVKDDIIKLIETRKEEASIKAEAHKTKDKYPSLLLTQPITLYNQLLSDIQENL